MTAEPRPIVVALGGNAITPPDESGDIEHQFAHTRASAEVLCDAVLQSYQLVITHGNGPQVGSVLRRVEIASSELYPIPLEVCVADTQAGMGYMIGQCLTNALRGRGVERGVTTIVTTVRVDADDPAFAAPDKPIGMAMPRDIAERHRDHDGWVITQIGPDQYRRIVPSPAPRQIMELATLRRMMDAGELIVCCGGGGVPVVRDPRGEYRGAAAVIDKDRTSALLAERLGVDTLVILTAVEHVMLGFGTPRQRPLRQLTAEQARAHLAAGQFADGSMRPKVEAALGFVSHSEHPTAAAIIARLDQLTAALAGEAGTRITRS